jgi:hypothetical protein
MDRGRVGEDRGSKETDGCPLTGTIDICGILLDIGMHAVNTSFPLRAIALLQLIHQSTSCEFRWKQSNNKG